MILLLQYTLTFASVLILVAPVSYTHLTLPTNSRV